MNTTKTLTIEEISKAITDIAQEYPIKRASLFGSYADGKATEDSDVDILNRLPYAYRITVLNT